ncbi:DUF6461 domain-containing protein [Nocardia sp. XZ_19_385]|uniref:DUF6461 domain-containing protein n=1 Tax=Nocardia sp. XZ_19_385 TaxID=2769488 RepID=UPI00188E5886|nr:DUF6461 domain-containing protein [Nocardia sp. XZ_19_385]
MNIPDEVADELVSTVIEMMRSAATRIPLSPAAALGRTGLPGAEDDFHASGSGLHSELDRFGPQLPERLLGALELWVGELTVPPVASLSALLPQRPDAMVMYGTVSGTGDTRRAIDKLEAFRPGALALVAAFAARLSEKPAVVALLRESPAALDETGVAAAHGRAYLAMCVAAAAIVLRSLGEGDDPAAVIGAALVAAGPLLRAAPMPPEYADAQLARIRADYLYPLRSAGSVVARDHRFALTEAEFPETVDFSENGLVAVVPGGIAVRTGSADAAVHIVVHVLENPPAEVDTVAWDEVVEVGWTANRGLASVLGAPEPTTWHRHASLTEQTPPWPGNYRVRVHATNRDDAGTRETYQLIVWKSPSTDTVVHKHTDRLGHRLRGEPEPPRVVKPEDAYRWIRNSALADAATITVVAGADASAVLEAFGANPAHPEPMDVFADRANDPWVAVVGVPGAVIAVEYNGYQGSLGPELRALSRGTRAASLYWNVNGHTRLSFATDGRVLAAVELGTAQTDPVLEPLLRDLDFADYRDHIAKGLVAVERFTGCGFTEADLARMETARIGFAVIPLLGELYPVPRQSDGSRARFGHGPLGPDTDILDDISAEQQREIAWWAARRAVEHVHLHDDPEVAASMADRALTPEAELRARKSSIGGRENYWAWATLHRATNPDPLAAAIGALEAATYAYGAAAADFVDSARARLPAK